MQRVCDQKVLVRGMSLVALAVSVSTFGVDRQAQADEPEIVVGEALSMETRFAEYFARNADDANQEFESGDSVMNATRTTTGNLRWCRFVATHKSVAWENKAVLCELVSLENNR